MALLFTPPFQTTNDINGSPISGALLYFYTSGTSTPASVYTTDALSVPHANPVVADSAGRFEAIYLDPAVSYRCKVTDASGTTIRDVDPIGDGLSSLLAASSGSSLVNFLQAGTGATSRTVQAKLRDVVSITDFGAVGDGATDDTAAIQAALNTGKAVFVPATSSYYEVSSTLALAAAGQRVFGEGDLSRIVQLGTNANSDVFTTTHDDCAFEGLNLTPGTTTNSLFNGYGIVTTGDRTIIRDNRVSGHRRGGIMLSDANNCTVTGNIMTASVVVGDGSEQQSETGYDIYVTGTSSYNLISLNHCLSGAGVGIGCQTATAGKSQYGNKIHDNMVRGHPAYGIMIYRSDSGDAIDYMSIVGNTVENISGLILTDGVTLFYGCGIYVASSDHFIIADNIVKNTNSDRSLAFSGSAVPAAIGISGFGNGTVNGNLIEDCYWGIASIQATALTAAGRGTIIANNGIRGADAQGIRLGDCVSASVTGNRIHGTGTQGIFAAASAAGHMDDFIVSLNRVDGFAVGIECSGTPINRAVITDNIVRMNSGLGISSTATTSIIRGNHIVGTTNGDGISVTSAVTGGLITDNVIDVPDNGIIADGGDTARVERNIILSATTPYSTSEYADLADTATPSVKGKKYFLSSGTTAVTNFTNGYAGQEIEILGDSSRTITNGATIKLAGAVNMSMTADDVLRLKLVGTVWIEQSRSVN